MDKAMEPYVTKAQLEREANEAEEATKEFHKTMSEGTAGMAAFFEEMSTHPIRIHNLEVMRAVDHYRPMNPTAHMSLEMGLMARIRERVLDDLKAWVTQKDLVPEVKAVMEEILAYLEPDDSNRGPPN